MALVSTNAMLALASALVRLTNLMYLRMSNCDMYDTCMARHIRPPTLPARGA